MKRKSVYIGLFLIGISLLISCLTNDNDNHSSEEESDYYVSPKGDGDKSGDSEKNAADFLNDKIWDKVRKSVKDKEVTVHFLDGEYGRAYTENKTLELFNLGNPNHQLLLKGGGGVIFTFPEGLDKHASSAIHVAGSQNMILDGFHFTGHGQADYGVRIYGVDVENNYTVTKNITLQNSTFIDMEGLHYGALQISGRKTNHITVRNNTMKRVGVDGSAHFIYTAGYAKHISVIDSHFEDCTGDYVRFRGGVDYGYVEGSKFVRNLDRFEGHGFISVPVFNDDDPGTELFETNFAFVDNEFENNSNKKEENAIRFLHWGHAPAEWDYLLTAEEGEILTSGTKQEKKELLLTNFGLDANKIRIHGNNFSSELITRNVGLVTALV